MLARTLPLLLLLALPAGANLQPADWQRVQREAAALLNDAGKLDRKLELINALASEDSARTAKLRIQHAAAAFRRREALAERAPMVKDAYFKIDRKLRKKHGRKVTRETLSKNRAWREKREAMDLVLENLEIEEAVISTIGEGFRKTGAEDAIAVLVDLSDKDVEEARRSLEIRAGILTALWKQPPARVGEHILVFAMDEEMPTGRVRAIDWIGAQKFRQGYDAVLVGLKAPQSAVARAAVAALRRFDDPGCVEPLIRARGKARGLLAEELEELLHYFTGRTFFGAGAGRMWAGWWRDEGQAWLAGERKERYEATQVKRKKEGAVFYGIATRSERIVFVLDRSGSMKSPIPQRGPVSGARKSKRVPGNTKLEVAKNELIRTIRGLASGVKFAVVFYSHDVRVWNKPPLLVPATSKNKRAAIAWVERLTPEGSTELFAALDQALAYAKIGGGKSATDPRGADTIYLLSDGAPTIAGRSDHLTGPGLEEAERKFLRANAPFKCVVHAIGVGPNHDRGLMQRLATRTGGTYKAVGID